MLSSTVACSQKADETLSANASLEPLLKIYGDGLVKTNQLIGEVADSTVLMIPKIAHHLLDAGGKRIRSLLLLASADLASKLSGNPYQTQKILALSAAVEMIHTATLLHDDVVDNSSLRRNKPTANTIWDNKLPILVGDYLFSCSFMLMVRSESLNVLEMLSATSAELAEGEVLQLQHEGDSTLPYEIYEQIINAKTASLFRASCHAGALLSTEDKILQQNLRQFGHEFGMVFQLVDDVMDYHATKAQMGKISGDDLREGKVTLPLILLRESTNLEQTQWIDNLIKDKSAQDNDLVEIQNLMQHYDIIARARAVVMQHGSKLHACLQSLAEQKSPVADRQQIDIIMTALHETVEFSLQRLY